MTSHRKDYEENVTPWKRTSDTRRAATGASIADFIRTPNCGWLPPVDEGKITVSFENGGVMKREFDVLIERDSEGYYVATVPALRGCHTQARSLDQLIDRVREAIQLCLEVEGDDAQHLDFVGVQRVAVE